MRRSLIVTVAAVVSMVLVALLVPMALLVRSYATEDRLAREALEVQATETVVSGQDKGAVAVYLDRVNRDSSSQTTVYYPDGTVIGPGPPEDQQVSEARLTGQASVTDTDSGARILVPVSLGGNSTLPSQTPVIAVEITEPFSDTAVLRAWLILALLAIVLLLGALVLADRLGRSFVQPVRALAAYAGNLGGEVPPEPVQVRGPRELVELGGVLSQLVTRIEGLLDRERRAVSDLSHRLRTPMTALRLGIDRLEDAEGRTQLGRDVDALQATVDDVVRRARRREREGLVLQADARSVLVQRAGFWRPLAEDQQRRFTVSGAAGGPVWVRAGEDDLTTVLDVLLDNVFTHTPEGAPVHVALAAQPDGGAVLTVEDGGPGFPADVDVRRRGTSAGGSTGLGLSIADEAATASGGRLVLGRSELGGARVEVLWGAAR